MARWQSRVVGATDTDHGVDLEIEDPYGRYTLTADWVLAADGARSPMRKMRGLRLKGDNYEGRYVIADIQMPHDYPTIRRALFDPDCRRGATILIHKQPDNIWRIDYQLGADEDEGDAIKEETVRASVTAVLDEIGYESDWQLEWWSIYSANTLALDEYRDGRIFFIGDSAHIVPIFGVRGLNNGLADAHNIAWKLAYVMQGKAAPPLLASYTPERRGATLDVFANASRSARFMTPPTRGWKVMRDAALNLALSHSFAGQLANPRQMTPYTYCDSPVVCADDPEFKSGPQVGAMLPEARIGDGYLTGKLGAGFSVLVFDKRLANDLDIAGVAVILIDAESEVAQQFGARQSSAYLVRPDLHIAARLFDATPATIQHALRFAAGEVLP